MEYGCSLPDVVNPAVYGYWYQQLKVEPECEVLIGLLVADVVDHTGLVQLRLQLVAQVAWNYSTIRVPASGPNSTLHKH